MGYGDDIMATAEAKEAKKLFPDANILIGDGRFNYPSIMYLNNPYISEIKNISENKNNIWILNYVNNRPYVNYVKSDNNKNVWDLEFSVKPGEIYLNQTELEHGLKIINQTIKLWKEHFLKSPKMIVLIEPNVKTEVYAKAVGGRAVGDVHLNRDWGFEKWQKIVNTLKDRIVFIQPHLQGVKKLLNAIHIDCNFRGALSILKYCDLFVGTHSGYSHAAAALKKDAINIFGGWISPSIVGYKTHTNLYVDLPESPCGSKVICNHCKKCMQEIEIDNVISILEKKIIEYNK
ncbi:MAG: hypothetical protein CFH22_01282 [Alphaproteobacteria bacterium MarineAlpha5_Bin12]|nr:hypothetical protein [Pelagibacteraceae bacterium]PPR40785.1 MAG: hypothetical protein CFH22_01282 [Alphaproteobacteria bacterium MarineAlpha5_Bin12]|tara:strand:- start:4619 stop:5488 length:870 start_codon:yes stop_codon:yes gene_type:complete